MGVMLLGTDAWISWRRGYAGSEAMSLQRVLRTGVNAIAAMAVPVVILGGILSGVATVTEAAAIGAISMPLRSGYSCTGPCPSGTSGNPLFPPSASRGWSFFLLGAPTVLGWYITRSGIAREAAEIIVAVSGVPSVQIAVVCLLLIFLGAFVDVLPAVVIAGPVLAPAMVQLGFDPLHFGMTMLLALNIGNITPPVGMTLLVSAKLSQVSYEASIRASLPFMATHLLVLILVAYIPQLALWLPAWLSSLGLI